LIHVQSPFPAGSVIVPTSGTPRYTAFFLALQFLKVPASTRLILTESCDLAKSLNEALEQRTGEWVWFLGDDHEFGPDTLLRLLNHRLPMVGTLNIQRISPFGPIMLRGETQAVSKPMAWHEIPTGGGLWALPADVYTGQAGLLVKGDLLKRVEPPWFRVGQYAPDRLNEDFYFNAQLRKLVPHMIDTGVVMGHINNFAIGAQVVDGQWKVTMSSHGKAQFQANPPAVQS